MCDTEIYKSVSFRMHMKTNRCDVRARGVSVLRGLPVGSLSTCCEDSILLRIQSVQSLCMRANAVARDITQV